METIIQNNNVSLDDVAKYLGVKPITIRSWIKKPQTEMPAREIGRA